MYWTENEGKKVSKRVVHFHNRESYFQRSFLLLADPTGMVIKPGAHVFPFKFQLPQNLPSSFEGKFGKIKYTLRCCIQKQYRNKILETSIDINVISLFNLNIVAGAWRPVYLNRCKRVPGDEQHSEGITTILLSTLKSGFVPGETILVQAQVRNGTSRYLKRVSLQLVALETYISKLRRTRDRRVLSLTRYEGGKVYPGQLLDWQDACLVVPQRIPPSGLPSCNIIQVMGMASRIGDILY